MIKNRHRYDMLVSSALKSCLMYLKEPNNKRRIKKKNSKTHMLRRHGNYMSQ